MPARYFWHTHLDVDEAAALARIDDAGRCDVLFTAQYPVDERSRALECFLFFLDGMFVTSAYEWFDFDDRDYWLEVTNEAGWRKLQAWVVEMFQAAETEGSNGLVRLEAARTGSPLGRAGGVESPTPATDKH